MNDQKKYYRELKRVIKKDGNRQRRNFFKRSLTKHPEDAHWDEFNFGRSSSKWLNGIDEEGQYEGYDAEDRDGGCDLPPGSGEQDHHPYRE